MNSSLCNTNSIRGKKSSLQGNQSTLPSDIHSGAMSPAQSKLMTKAQSISNTSTRFNNTAVNTSGRKMQTVARETNQKFSAQRSTSRGANVRDFRQIRTDTRGINQEQLSQDGEETKESTISQSTGTVTKLNPNGTVNTGRSMQNTLRDSHDSMRSIQKQRIQRSLQKSQEGRKKLEEKLEAISSREIQQQQNLTTINPDQRSLEKIDGNLHNKYETTPLSGSLLATKGGFHNMRNKDQIKDQMLASINKIKSFRETGEFDITNLSAIQSATPMSHDVHLDTQQDYQSLHPRESDVLLAEPPEQQPEAHRDERHASYNDFIQNSSQDNFSNHSVLQNFQSCKSTKNTSIGNQLHMINSQLKNNTCNNLEEAQPFLKMCLISINGCPYGQTMGTEEQFSSILSGSEHTELDKNLICPKCNYIVVLPVECRDCQYIICYKCAQESQMLCQDQQCGEKISSKPGKIHKLYKEMLRSLEFRCPNQAQGCCKTIGYDMLDHHLQKSCDANLQLCPNRCSRSKKFTVEQLQKHIGEDCPKECVPCPQCKQIKYRDEIEMHLEEICDKVLVDCQSCGKQDMRLSFRTGKHECKMEEYYCGNNRDKGIRNYEEVAQRFQSSEHFISGPVTQAQVRVVNEELKNLQNLIVVEIIQMIDNLSKDYNEKVTEIEELKMVQKKHTDEIKVVVNINKQLEDDVKQCNMRYHQIQAQFVQQADSHDEIITILTSKMNQQSNKIEDLQNLVIEQIGTTEKQMNNLQDNVQDQNRKYIQQANKHAEILAKLGIKQDQNNNLISNQETFVKQMSQNNQNQLNQMEEQNQNRDQNIKEIKKDLENVSVAQLNQKQIEDLIKNIVSNFDQKLNKVNEKQKQFQNDNEQLQQLVLETIKKQNQPSPDPIHLGNVTLSENVQNDRNAYYFESQEEQKLQESTVESLDDEILQQHYAKQQEAIQREQAPFQKQLKVPPINIQGAKIKNQQAQRRKSPKLQKHYSEDPDSNSLVPQCQNSPDDGVGQQVSQQIRYFNNQYQSVPTNSQEKQPESGKDNSGSRKEIEIQAQQTSNSGFDKLDAIVEDIDETQFIPAYLSSTEHDIATTDLNKTELNTEYNTSRPLYNQGGQTDRNSARAPTSARKKDRLTGGLTDRNKGGTQQLLTSEIQSSMHSTYMISQSTNKDPEGDKSGSECKDSDGSMSDDINRSHAVVDQSPPEKEAQEESKAVESLPEPDSFINDSEPEIADNVQESSKQPEQIRKSVPKSTGVQPYNENLMKTFESSEFDQNSPEQLPGMIFGMNRPSEPKHELLNTQPTLKRRDSGSQQLKQESPMESKQSERSLGLVQVNIDNTLSKFYAKDQNQLDIKQQNSQDDTKLEEVDNKIQQESPNPYDGINLFSQSVKINKSKQADFLDESNSKEIEREIQDLAKKYSQEKKQPNQKSEPRNSSAKNKSKKSAKRSKNSAQKKKRLSKDNKKESSDSFERDETNENLDKLIDGILEDDSFKQEETLKVGTQASNPFELTKQITESPGSQGSEIDQIIQKATRITTSGERSEESKEDSSDENDIGREGPQPTGLVSDLDTIMETDQESNYMTTTRTNAYKSQVSNQPKSNENNEVIPQMKEKELPLDQTIISLNESSFMLTDSNNALPAALFGGIHSQAQPKEEYEEEAPVTNRDEKKNNNSILNDISPISHAIDPSQFQNTSYTNMLDSLKSNPRKQEVNISEINIEMIDSSTTNRNKIEDPDDSIDILDTSLPKHLYDITHPESSTHQSTKQNDSENETLKSEQSIPKIVPIDIDETEDLSEQRIKQYHNKVLSAISASAKNKQKEQQLIESAIERSLKTAGEEEDNQIDILKTISEKDNESIELELQEIIKRNRAIYEQKDY